MMSTTTEEQINAGEETEVEEVEVDEDIDVASMNADGECRAAGGRAHA